MDREAKIIHHEMERTRESLTDKLETLENKVTGTVQDATSVVQDATAAVSDTVETVQDAVQETVATVKETVQEAVGSVKEAFDIIRQVERHPWLMMGGAVAAGFFGERLLTFAVPASRADRMASLMSQASSSHHGNGRHDGNGKQEQPGASAETAEPEQHGGLGQLLHSELGQLKKLAIGATIGLARNMATQSLTKEFSEPLAHIMDSITSKLGGEPLPAHKLPEQRVEDAKGKGQERDDRSSPQGFVRQSAM